jgi:signal transduction histidine kinase
VLIEDVYKQMKPLAEGKVNLSLQGIVEAWVTGDAYRLKQVFVNLISNAIQYTSKRSDVRIGMTKTEKVVKVSISDTGPGIPAEDLPHIFERFFRVEPSRPRNKESGFGLGLSISNWIIRQHHGEIQVKSQVGEGTIFTVILNLQKKGK